MYVCPYLSLVEVQSEGEESKYLGLAALFFQQAHQIGEFLLQRRAYTDHGEQEMQGVLHELPRVTKNNPTPALVHFSTYSSATAIVGVASSISPTPLIGATAAPFRFSWGRRSPQCITSSKRHQTGRRQEFSCLVSSRGVLDVVHAELILPQSSAFACRLCLRAPLTSCRPALLLVLLGSTEKRRRRTIQQFHFAWYGVWVAAAHGEKVKLRSVSGTERFKRRVVCALIRCRNNAADGVR